MSAPPNWRGEFRGFDEGAAGGASAAAASSAGSDAAREELETRSSGKFQHPDKDKEWEGDPTRFSCLLTIRHGTGREQRYGPRYRMLSCGYNIDGTQICTASEDKTCRIYDRVSQKQLLKLVHQELVRCAAISHSGRYVCTGSDDQHCRMFPIYPEDHPELKKGEELYWLHHAGWLTSITFGQYDRLLLTTSRDRVARIWDIGHMELRVAATKWKLEDPIHHATFSPDQTRVAFASGAQRYFGVVSVYHTERGQVDGGGHQITAPLGLIEHPDSVSCVAFSSNHRYLGSGCLDGEARVFDVRSSFDQVATFKHPNFIRTVSFTPCNKCICTACEDGCIRIFNIALRKELQCFHTGEPLTWSVLSPSGLEVCCTSSEGQLQIWGVEGRISRRLKEHQRSLEGSLDVVPVVDGFPPSQNDA